MNFFARLIPGFILVLIGCAAPPQEAVKPEVPQVFPPPPAEARYSFERRLYGSSDLVSKAKDTTLLALLVGDPKGHSASGDGLARPQALAVHHGLVYVANSLDSAVSVFDIAQRNFYKIGETGAGALRTPSGLSVDRVYAIDTGEGQHRVRAFNSLDGRHLFDFGTRGDGPGEFNFPYDLAVGKDGRIYVADQWYGKLDIFRPLPAISEQLSE